MNVDGDAVMDLWPALLGYVRRRLQSESEAGVEDVAGEAIVRTLAAECELDDRPNALKNWLYTVAARLCIDRYRRRALIRFAPLDEVDWSLGTADAGSERHVEIIDLRAVLAEAVEGQWAIARAVCEGVSTSDVGQAFGVSRQAVKHRAMRERRRLRQALEGEPAGGAAPQRKPGPKARLGCVATDCPSPDPTHYSGGLCKACYMRARRRSA